jgi:hypothetical protein|tara:strand:+ start:181 stop:402 length:222 start_codon:yes stop_codon:yes gene_type:complete
VQKQGKCAEEIPLAKKFTELAIKEFGESHPIHGTGLNFIAGLYQLQGRYTDAEPLFKVTGLRQATKTIYCGNL